MLCRPGSYTDASSSSPLRPGSPLSIRPIQAQTAGARPRLGRPIPWSRQAQKAAGHGLIPSRQIQSRRGFQQKAGLPLPNRSIRPRTRPCKRSIEPPSSFCRPSSPDRAAGAVLVLLVLGRNESQCGIPDSYLSPLVNLFKCF